LYFSRDSRDGQTQPNREERPAEVKKAGASPPAAAAARPRAMTASEIRQRLAGESDNIQNKAVSVEYRYLYRKY